MNTVPFIDYKNLYGSNTKQFYLVDEVCEIFQMNCSDLRYYAEKHNILPERNEIGQAGFSTYNLCRLHKLIYVETHPQNVKNSVWDD